jgi:hypothetical protein
MSRHESPQDKVDAAAARLQSRLNNPGYEPPKPRLAHEFKRWPVGSKPWPMTAKVLLGVGAVGVVVLGFHDEISKALTPDENYQDYSITKDPAKPFSESSKLAPMPTKEAGTPASTKLEVGQTAVAPVCKTTVFWDKTHNIKIYDPIVDVVPGDPDAGLMPRTVTRDKNNGSLEIGPVMDKPTDYEWLLANNTETKVMKYCAGVILKAEQFATGPHQNDTLRLHEEGYDAYNNVPVTGPRQGIAHFVEQLPPSS